MSNSLPLVFLFCCKALYAFIGLRLGNKIFANAKDANAWRAFRAWWFGMALNNAFNTLEVLTLSLGYTAMPLFIFYSLVSTLAAAAALWGLLTYLMYIYTGGDRTSKWIAAFYIAFAIFVLVSIYLFSPNSVSMGDWPPLCSTKTHPQACLGLSTASSCCCSACRQCWPVSVCSACSSVHERSARYRALLMPLGLFALFGMAYLIPLVLLLLFGININQSSLVAAHDTHHRQNESR